VSLVGARQLIEGPKTPAGVRTIALPMWLLPELERHFADYSEQAPNGRTFEVGADDGNRTRILSLGS
jgi:hypothetical protein